MKTPDGGLKALLHGELLHRKILLTKHEDRDTRKSEATPMEIFFKPVILKPYHEAAPLAATLRRRSTRSSAIRASCALDQVGGEL